MGRHRCLLALLTLFAALAACTSQTVREQRVAQLEELERQNRAYSPMVNESVSSKATGLIYLIGTYQGCKQC